MNAKSLPPFFLKKGGVISSPLEIVPYYFSLSFLSFLFLEALQLKFEVLTMHHFGSVYRLVAAVCRLVKFGSESLAYYRQYNRLSLCN